MRYFYAIFSHDVDLIRDAKGARPVFVQRYRRVEAISPRGLDGDDGNFNWRQSTATGHSMMLYAYHLPILRPYIQSSPRLTTHLRPRYR